MKYARHYSSLGEHKGKLLCCLTFVWVATMEKQAQKKSQLLNEERCPITKSLIEVPEEIKTSTLQWPGIPLRGIHPQPKPACDGLTLNV